MLKETETASGYEDAFILHRAIPVTSVVGYARKTRKRVLIIQKPAGRGFMRTGLRKRRFRMRMKRFRLPAAALCVVFLLLAACGAAVPSDGPGLGKWRNSDIAGSMQRDEKIRVQDDFAAAVNQDWAVDAEPGSGSMMSAMLAVMDKKQQILEQEYRDHDGQELKKFYDLAADWKGRDQAGAEPLRPYLDAIAQISSPEDLAAYMCDREKNPLGLGILMPGAVTQSGLDPAVYLMKIEGPDRLLGSAEEYFNLDAGGMEQQEYVRKVTDHVLGALGYTEEEIRSLLADNYRFEKKAAGAEVNLAEDEDKAISLSFDECAEALLEDYPLGRILDAWGVPRDVQFYMNSKSARRLSALYTQENIPQIRAMLTVHLVMETASWLDRETVDLAQKAKEGRLQEAPESSLPEERRDQYLQQTLRRGGKRES
ncbi:MAG: M13 family metallopeptidase [Sarcina sp.]|nr:M13 family metallopeptidase [Sarcina sp.]